MFVVDSRWSLCRWIFCHQNDCSRTPTVPCKSGFEVLIHEEVKLTCFLLATTIPGGLILTNREWEYSTSTSIIFELVLLDKYDIRFTPLQQLPAALSLNFQ